MTANSDNNIIESHHGVLLTIFDYGVLIIGEAGIGKSSLALDFLANGHGIVADDCVDFKTDENNVVIGCCPPILANLLHTRELGLISISEVFNAASWQQEIPLTYIVRLQKDITTVNTLSLTPQFYTICKQSFPMLNLAINNPATLYNRITTWLTLQAKPNNAIITFKQRQRVQMEK